MKLGWSQRGSDTLGWGKGVVRPNSLAEQYKPSLTHPEPSHLEYKPAKACLNLAAISLIFWSFLMSPLESEGPMTVYGQWHKLSQQLPYSQGEWVKD